MKINFSFTARFLNLTIWIFFSFTMTQTIKRRNQSYFEKNARYLLETLQDLDAKHLNQNYLTREQAKTQANTYRKLRRSQNQTDSDNTSSNVTQSESEDTDIDQNNPSLPSVSQSSSDHQEPESNLDSEDESAKKTVFDGQEGNITKSFEEDDIDDSEITVDSMDKEKNQLLEKLKEYGDFDLEAQKCFFFQKSLSFLPGYDPVKSSIKKLFFSNQGKKPKCFRSYALEILVQQALLRGEEKDQSEDIQLVNKLRQLKKTYYEEIILKNPKANRIKDDRKEKAEKKIKSLFKDYMKAKKKKSKLEGDIKLLGEELDFLASSIQRNQKKNDPKSFENLNIRKQEIEENISNLDVAEDLTAIKTLKEDLIIEAKSMKTFVALKYRMVILAKYRKLYHIFKDMVDFTYAKSEKLGDDEYNEFQTIKKKRNKLDGMIEKNEKRVEKLKNKMNKQFKKLLKATEKQIKNIQDYKEYNKKYQKIVKMKKKLVETERDFSDKEKKHEDLKEWLYSNGIKPMEKTNFLIPLSDLDVIEREYHNYLKISREINAGLDPKDQFPIILEQSEDGVFVRNQNKEREDEIEEFVYLESPFDSNLESGKEAYKNLFEYSLNNLNRKQKKKYNNAFNMSSKDQKNFKSVKKMALKEIKSIEKLFNYSTKNYELAKDIVKYEKQIDRRLGQLFADVYRLGPDLKCLSDSRFAFNLFNITKINGIYDVSEFLVAFMTDLASRSPEEFRDVKRLIILIGSLYESEKKTVQTADRLSKIQHLQLTPEELEELQKSETDNHNALTPTLKEEISKFAQGFSLMADSYKELTDFAQDLESQENSIFGRIKARMKNFLYKSFLFIIETEEGALKKQVINKDKKLPTNEEELESADLIKKLVHEFFELTGILNDIPFISTWLKRIMVNLLTMLFEFIVTFIKNSIKKAVNSVGSVLTKFGKAEEKRNLLKLDWVSEIRDMGNPDIAESGDTSPVKPAKLETVFFEASENQKDSYNQLENLSVQIFNKKEKDVQDRLLEMIELKKKTGKSGDVHNLSNVGFDSNAKSSEKKLSDLVHFGNDSGIGNYMENHLEGIYSENEDMEAQYKASLIRGCLALV